MMRTLGPAALVLTAVVAVAGCGGSGSSAETDDRQEVARNVRVLTMAPMDLEEYLPISGPVRPVRGADVSTEEGGTVKEIVLEKGRLVRRGEAVILLDRDLLRAELDAAVAARRLREFNEEQTRKLFDANSVSGQEMLQAHTLHEEAKAQEEVARLRWERAAIKAPYDGLVANRYVEVGQLVAPGTPVCRVVDPFTLKLVGSVTEAEVQWVDAGSRAEVFLDGHEGAVEGRVHWVGFEADPKTGKFGVEVRIDNPDVALRPGVVGRARIHKLTHEGVLAIPRDAVVEGAEGPRVYLVEEGRAQPRPVRLGADQGVMVMVAEGLRAGDRLVVRGQRDLVPGVPVEVRETADRPDGSMAGDPVEVRGDFAPGEAR
jgi:membrane fusion protein (multidrug efflux system)